MNPVSCFSGSYRAARASFLSAAAARGFAVDSRVLPGFTGLEGEELATDVVRLGPIGARRMLVLLGSRRGLFRGSCYNEPSWLTRER